MNSNCYSIAERLQKLEEFREWMIERDIRVTGTRIEQYIDTYKSYLPLFESRTFPQEQVNEYIFVLREVEELIWIYRGLLCGVPSGALPTLQKAIRGSIVSKEEIDKTARNYLLELRVASFFLQSGFPVDMSSDADLVAQLSHIHLHIECKRLDSRGKIQQRAKETLKQIQRRCNSCGEKNSYGMAVFDVGRVLHPGQGVSYGPYRTGMLQGIRGQLISFDEEFRLERIFLKDRRVIAIWYQIITPVLTMIDSDIGAQFSALHISLVPATGVRGEAFQELKRAFEIQ